jgi:hypothetical protein
MVAKKGVARTGLLLVDHDRSGGTLVAEGLSAYFGEREQALLYADKSRSLGIPAVVQPEAKSNGALNSEFGLPVAIPLG